MDMKELFKNGCFTPEWTEQEAVYKEEAKPWPRTECQVGYNLYPYSDVGNGRQVL